MQNEATSTPPEGYAYKITKIKPRAVSLRRSESRTMTVTVRNTGSAAWYDIAKKKTALKNSKTPTVPKFSEQHSFDFRLHWGIKDQPTNKKFETIYQRGKSEEAIKPHIVMPGQYVDIPLELQAKKYAAKGRHSLRITLGNEAFDYPTSAVSKLPHVRVLSNTKWPKHIARAVKLKMRRNLGSVRSEVKNQAYKDTKDEQVTPVVMAVWQRIENLSDTITALKAQSTPVALTIWNNNQANEAAINTLVRNTDLPIQVLHSEENIGGYGRFYAAAKLSTKHEYVVFIDDDQQPEKTYVETLRHEASHKTIVSSWAHTFLSMNNYWHKKVTTTEGEVHYTGTGGMICPTWVFLEKAVFECPKIFWFIEDLWLSYVATDKLGMSLHKSKASLVPKDDGKDQSQDMIDLKTYMLRYLTRFKKWSIGVSQVE